MLYNGRAKPIQSRHYAALQEVDLDRQGYQQCADCAIRLWSEYHFQKGNYSAISFRLTNGMEVPYNRWRKGYRVEVGRRRTWWEKTSSPNTSYGNLRDYLDLVYRFAGSYSLSKELHPVEGYQALRPGDLLVKGGLPGHVAIVADIAEHRLTGERIFLLMQGSTPAQDIEVLRNPQDFFLSPWFRVPDANDRFTGGHQFREFRLMQFRE